MTTWKDIDLCCLLIELIEARSPPELSLGTFLSTKLEAPFIKQRYTIPIILIQVERRQPFSRLLKQVYCKQDEQGGRLWDQHAPICVLLMGSSQT